MIQKIKKIVIENKKTLNLENIDEELICVSKFYHGEAKDNSKILFLISYRGKLLGLLKVARNESGNSYLKKEFDEQSYFLENSETISIPKIYFQFEINNHFAYMEEVIDGEVVGSENSSDYIKDIYIFQNEIQKREKISVAEIINIVDNGSSDKKLNSLLKFFKEHRDKHVYLSKSHGDLTYMNVIASKQGNKVFLIDWERANEKNIWGLDFTHYFSRYSQIKNIDDFILKIDEFIKENNCGVSRDDFVVFYLLDNILDLYFKKNKEKYYKIISSLNNN